MAKKPMIDLRGMWADSLAFVERNLPKRHVWLFIVGCFGTYLLRSGIDITSTCVFMVILTNLSHVNDAITDWKRRSRTRDSMAEEQALNDDAVRKGRKRIRADEPELPLEKSVGRAEMKQRKS